MTMTYEQKFKIGDIVKGKRTFNGEVIEGKFNGFRLYNKLNPKSVVGVIDTNERCYDVSVDSIESLESEDEKIRKGLIKGLSAMRDIHKHQTFSDDAISIDDAIAWLEKQGEHVEWNERYIADVFEKFGLAKIVREQGNDELMNAVQAVMIELAKQGEQKPIELDTEIRDLWVYIREWNDKFGRLPKDEDELASCIDYVMKRQKPTWSEEDEKTMEFIITILKCAPDMRPCSKIYHESAYQKQINWLKSLKPQPRWKPTGQNIKDLEWCAELFKEKMGVGFHRLQVFIDELKNFES